MYIINRHYLCIYLVNVVLETR